MSQKVIVYSKPDCTYCVRLKRWMDINNYAYQEVNVMEDREALLHVRDNGNLEDGVIKMPQVEVNGEFVSHQPYSNLEAYLK